MLSNMRFPIIPLRKRMMCKISRPTPLDNIPRCFTRRDDFIRECTCLAQNQHVQRIIQVVMIHNRILQGVRRLQLHIAPRSLVKQQRAHSERVLVVDREVGELLRTAVKFGVPEFHVWLRGCEAHGVSSFLPLRVIPELRVFETLVQSCVAEDAEWECRQYSSFLLLVQPV
jgi:hypothetical protein